MVRNITLVQHLVHWLNSENYKETSARVRGNSDFFKLKIKNSAGAELELITCVNCWLTHVIPSADAYGNCCVSSNFTGT